ncbi:oxidoreductase [Ochrobactrum sp. MYb15]|uniref:oxidoreductase n=1 Tax=Brucella pituitosa TaxID=571256 RepID=UPI000CFD56EB|nr:oxidoreductase [Ochrobactrum sp. MYb19]PRA55560.1 oxidoreductase [Ochrobactrum sp. MYb68]PRA68630.1 oxidoreductase [Ochrobactrum sp. MYb18]PRA74142.1 oxidoreductase [Brucella thiophenivorans]PRA90882.1 oxidoreductase [Ochrobactrum sp. MYb14]PRA96333.1 oxidoreductase [Ochrobactrum sp. MYb15]
MSNDRQRANTRLSKQELARRVAAYQQHGTITKAAHACGVKKSAFHDSIKRAAEMGLMGPKETLPGYAIKSLTETPNGTYMRQAKEAGPVYEATAGLAVKGKTTLVNSEGRIVTQHIMERADADQQRAAITAMVEALKEDLPRVSIMPAPKGCREDLLNFFCLTDAHFGMLAWREETGADYDIEIAEQLVTDWFSASIDLAPDAHTAVFAQLGDLAHYDSMETVTPASKHVLDSDSRLQKIIRVIIRTVRRVIDMLLQKHRHVHIIMAQGNHDPASSAWLREMLAAMYENEPRITVDNSPSLYYAYEWGSTAIFAHHGHKRGVNNVDATLAGKFREMYGRSKYAYAHIGHLHSDEGRKSGLMYVERHETLAAPDAYAAGGGWLSGRSAKIITYSKLHGEVSRLTLRPEMVAGKYAAANDNVQIQRDAA